MHRPKVNPDLDNELKEFGINPDVFIESIERSTQMDVRTAAHDASGLHVSERSRAPLSLREASEAIVLDTKPDPAGDPQDEAFKLVKRKLKTAKDKVLRRLKRLKNRAKRSTIARASRQYYKRMKRKISKKMKKLRAKFGGGAGLSKVRAGGRKRILSTGMDRVATLHEDLNRLSASVEAAVEPPLDESKVSDYAYAALQAGQVSALLADRFELYGDTAAAEALNRLSDVAADLSEDLDVEDPPAEAVEKLDRVMRGVIRALKTFEEIGSPSLVDLIESASRPKTQESQPQAA